MAKFNYLVLSKLTFDGKDYGPAEDDKTVVLDEKVGAPLVDAGVLREGSAVAAPEGEERAAAVVAFFQTLTVGDFTQGGGLRAEARRRAATTLGFEPTDEELKAAAEAHAKAQAGGG